MTRYPRICSVLQRYRLLASEFLPIRLPERHVFLQARRRGCQHLRWRNSWRKWTNMVSLISGPPQFTVFHMFLESRLLYSRVKRERLTIEILTWTIGMICMQPISLPCAQYWLVSMACTIPLSATWCFASRQSTTTSLPIQPMSSSII